MESLLAGKKVLITGAASGIGRAVARRVAEAGGAVVIGDVNAAAGSALASELQGEFVPLDVTSEAQWTELANTIGNLDYAHLNAGIMSRPPGDPLSASDVLTLDLADYRKLMAVNVDGVLLGVRALAPLLAGRGGAVCVTASMAGLVALPFDVAYAMSKHALVGLVRSLGSFWSDTNLRINAICPGGVDTSIVPDDLKDGRLMSPDVIAAEVIDLLVKGANGEIRVKMDARHPARSVPAPELA